MGSLTKQNYIYFGYSTAILLLLGFTYIGNLQWLWSRWMENPDYSHGPLIPLISLYILFQKREEVRKIEEKGSIAGIIIIFFALLFYIVSFRAQVNFIQSYSMIICIIGIVLFLYGREMLAALLFPIGFLFFMVPFWSGAIIKLSNLLKILSTTTSYNIISMLGYAIFKDGVTLHLSNGALEVADPCSGIRSLMALLSLGTVIAYFSETHIIKKFLIVLFTIPLTIIGNSLRVVFFAIVLQKQGIVITEGPLHTLSGLMVFVFAFIVLIGFSKWLKHT